METLLDNFKGELEVHFRRYLVHVSKRYRVNITNLFADFDKFQAGKLEILEDDSIVTSPVQSEDGPPVSQKTEPAKTAKVIKNLVGESDSESDAQSEVKTRVKKLNSVIDSSNSSSSSSSSDSSDDEEDSEDKEDKEDSEATVTLSTQTESDEEVIDLAPPSKKENKGKKDNKKKIVIEEVPSDDEEGTENEDDEPSESEPLPKKGNKGKKAAVKKVAVKGKKDTKKSIKDLADKPKTATECSVPKGTQFLKGTNLVVVKGKVVAAVNKKGFVKLDKRYLKSFDNPDYSEIKHEVWDKEKIDKKFNK